MHLRNQGYIYLALKWSTRRMLIYRGVKISSFWRHYQNWITNLSRLITMHTVLYASRCRTCTWYDMLWRGTKFASLIDDPSMLEQALNVPINVNYDCLQMDRVILYKPTSLFLCKYFPPYPFPWPVLSTLHVYLSLSLSHLFHCWFCVDFGVQFQRFQSFGHLVSRNSPVS